VAEDAPNTKDLSVEHQNMSDAAQDVVTSDKKDVEENVLTSGRKENATTEARSTEDGQNSEPKNQEEEGPEDEKE
ncbi:hypothetical protein A2U01_0101337, partial [Trifolium medium]|nr:hypothetical protein [Trifolium medium]